jgi:selenocysteine-specific elongation factor
MKHVIIGTAGHVDHGKTTLIQALTGTNPDRLKEEQERGMTIDIGFAALKLPDGTVAGIVDVPGHERFLKNMLAGASGVDVVLLVIAADESVMPQTVEHLDILRLLDVRNGVVALTKCDMVDAEWVEAVEEDVRAHLKNTFLAAAPILRVSAVTGKGIDALKKALLSAVSRSDERNTLLPFRLPVDRVFMRPGFGTVVTGTLVSGTMRIGDAVEIVPQKITTRIRGLQVHGQKVQEAFAGSRVAVNVAGVETEAIERGAQLAPPGSITPTHVMDAVMRMLPNASKPLKDRARVRIHIGTAEVLGRVRFLDDKEELEPGGSAYVQFRGELDFACARGDRFVVRSYSPMQTIAGGIVLDTQPARHRKNHAETLTALEAKERGMPEDVLETVLQRFPVGLLRKDIPAQSGLTPAEAETALQMLLRQNRAALLAGDRVFQSTTLQAVTDRALTLLESYHQQFPLRAGMPKEELRSSLGRDMDNRAYASLLAYWQEQNQVRVETATVRKAEFQVALNERQQALLARIEDIYKEWGIANPTLEDVVREVKAPPDAVNALLRVGVDRGYFARLADGVYYHSDTIVELQRIVRDYIAQNGSITVAAFRDLTNSNRKYSLQVLEYFDSIRFTRRAGDERTLSNL